VKSSKRTLLLLSVFFFAVTSILAQSDKHETKLRTVRGVVVDKIDAPISGSVVFLKNSRTNVVSTHITDDEGTYRFSGLDPNADYNIYAEKDGAKSPAHNVSSFDGRKEIVLNLKIAKKGA